MVLDKPKLKSIAVTVFGTAGGILTYIVAVFVSSKATQVDDNFCAILTDAQRATLDLFVMQGNASCSYNNATIDKLLKGQ
eukprot:COSAG06_NODE_576_length_14051_cov_5.354644_3_plen_80_part_00